jgi:chemotaxis signal transduction protein
MGDNGVDGKTWIIHFDFQGERWGLLFTDVQEVMEGRGITPVPKTPSFVAGVTHQRGRIITVIDLPALLGKPEEPGKKNKLLLLKSESMNVALLINAVIATELLPEKPAAGALEAEEIRVHGEAVIGRRLTLQDHSRLNLVEADKVVLFLERFPFS